MSRLLTAEAHHWVVTVSCTVSFLVTLVAPNRRYIRAVFRDMAATFAEETSRRAARTLLRQVPDFITFHAPRLCNIGTHFRPMLEAAAPETALQIYMHCRGGRRVYWASGRGGATLRYRRVDGICDRVCDRQHLRLDTRGFQRIGRQLYLRPLSASYTSPTILAHQAQSQGIFSGFRALIVHFVYRDWGMETCPIATTTVKVHIEPRQILQLRASDIKKTSRETKDIQHVRAVSCIRDDLASSPRLRQKQRACRAPVQGAVSFLCTCT